MQDGVGSQYGGRSWQPLPGLHPESHVHDSARTMVWPFLVQGSGNGTDTVSILKAMSCSPWPGAGWIFGRGRAVSTDFKLVQVVSTGWGSKPGLLANTVLQSNTELPMVKPGWCFADGKRAVNCRRLKQLISCNSFEVAVVTRRAGLCGGVGGRSTSCGESLLGPVAGHFLWQHRHVHLVFFRTIFVVA
jgi:hypothetical protein